MIEIRHRDPDGYEGILITKCDYMASEPKLAAVEIAHDDYYNNCDLHDPDNWPRTYEIYHEGEWKPFAVQMTYDPSFSV